MISQILLLLLSALLITANERCDQVTENNLGIVKGQKSDWKGWSEANNNTCIRAFDVYVNVTQALAICRSQLTAKGAENYYTRLVWIRNRNMANFLTGFMWPGNTGKYWYFFGLRSSKIDGKYSWFEEDGDKLPFKFGTYPPNYQSEADFGYGDVNKEYMVISRNLTWIRAYGNLVHPFICELVPKTIKCNCISNTPSKYGVKEGAIWKGCKNANPKSCISVFEQLVDEPTAMQTCQEQLTTDEARAKYGVRLVWIQNENMQNFALSQIGGAKYYFIGLRSQNSDNNYEWYDADGDKVPYVYGTYPPQYQSSNDFEYASITKGYMALNRNGTWTKAYGDAAHKHGFICELFLK